jgi:carbon-monoxide dehydrogenase small subunit
VLQKVTLIVNQETHELEIDVHRTLLEVLRDNLGLTGSKYGCGNGECGACTVLVEGKPILSCLTMAMTMDGKEITTIEGLAKNGELHPVQAAFIEHGAVECGFCTPGAILAAKALLDENPKPTKEDIKQYLKGNLCRCTGYVKIVEAVLGAAKTMGRGE